MYVRSCLFFVSVLCAACARVPGPAATSASMHLRAVVNGVYHVRTASDLAQSFAGGVRYQPRNILTRYNVPLPPSMNGAVGASVESVYSPTAALFNGNTIRMTFGVSLGCRVWSARYGWQLVLRDSIAQIIVDTNGNVVPGSFQYVLEPNPTVCFNAVENWYLPAIYEVNDPHVIEDPATGKMLMYYTVVDNPHTQCGSIGMAELSRTTGRVVSRNDYFLRSGSTGSCLAPGSRSYSRPTVHWRNGNPFRLIFDKYGVVAAAYFGASRLSPIAESSVAHLMPAGEMGYLDVDTPFIDGGAEMPMLYGSGTKISARLQNAAGAWGAAYQVTRADPYYNRDQGSPNLFIDKRTCRSILFHSGSRWERTPYGDYTVMIAADVQPANLQFDLARCGR